MDEDAVLSFIEFTLCLQKTTLLWLAITSTYVYLSFAEIAFDKPKICTSMRASACSKLVISAGKLSTFSLRWIVFVDIFAATCDVVCLFFCCYYSCTISLV